MAYPLSPNLQHPPRSPSEASSLMVKRQEPSQAPQPPQPPPLTRAEERRLVLAELDTAEFTKFHSRIALTTAAGFFTDAYDVFSINLTTTMIGLVYSNQPGGKLAAGDLLSFKISTPIGNLLGQVLFGWLADKYGRKKMYGVELLIMGGAVFGQALAGQGPSVSVFGALIVWRVIMGVGIGGDYPTSAVISSEFSAVRFRGRMITSVVAMQGFGIIVAAIVALIVTAAYKSSLEDSVNLNHVDDIWRIVIGIGAIPSVLAVWYRLTIPESPRYTMDVERNLEQASADADFVSTGKFDTIEDRPIQRLDHLPRASRSDFINYYSKWDNFKILLSCSWSWFITDYVFYGLSFNPTTFIQAIGYGPVDSSSDPQWVWKTLYHGAIGNIVLCCAGIIPGYWLTFFFIDKWGRKPIQYLGFSMLAILFAIMGLAYRPIMHTSPKLFAFLYSLANLFQNFGPNCTTFVIPAELFPTRYRAVSHGIAATAGKLGAIVAQVVLLYVSDIGKSNHWFDPMLVSMSVIMVTGLISTSVLPEAKGKSLEYLAGEEEADDNFRHDEESSISIPMGITSFVNLLRRKRASRHGDDLPSL